MAIAVNYKRVAGHLVLEATLLDAVTGMGLGEWVDVSGLYTLNVHVSGITTATVDIRGSNSVTRPSNSSHEIQIQDTDVDVMIPIIFPIHWIKARVSAYTSGTITVMLYGNQFS